VRGVNRFHRVEAGVELSLDPAGSEVIAVLLAHVDGMLEPPPVGDPLEALVGLRSTPPPIPTDPAIARLLPEAYRDDGAASADFRRRTSDDLRAGKREAAKVVLATLPAAAEGVALLGEDEVDAWLRSLTDLRLVLGSRLGLVDDESADELDAIDPDDSRRPTVEVYFYLSSLQDGLVRILT
jgi:hypothetical protein